MANIKYFHGADELRNVYAMPRKEFEAKFPGVKGIGWDWYSRLVGINESRELVYADRRIEYKQFPSRHECDARCLNANGKIMRCECSCGGKNHGLGTMRSFKELLQPA